MIIEVNRAASEGHDRCEVAAPEIFDLAEDGYSSVLVDDITPDFEAAARAGAKRRSCCGDEASATGHSGPGAEQPVNRVRGGMSVV